MHDHATSRACLLSLCVVLSTSAACGGDDAPPSESEQGSGNSDTESPDTDAGSTTDAAETTGVPETDGADTESTGADTETGGEDLPLDCSCYDPWIDETHPTDSKDFESCRDATELFPGCEIDYPCALISLYDPSGCGPDGEPAFDDPEAVACVARRLAEGELPAFQVSDGNCLSGQSQTYVPRPDGTFYQYTCYKSDAPSEETDIGGADPDPEALAVCVATYDKDGDAFALYDCLVAQLGGGGSAGDACGG